MSRAAPPLACDQNMSCLPSLEKGWNCSVQYCHPLRAHTMELLGAVLVLLNPAGKQTCPRVYALWVASSRTRLD